MSTRAPEPEEPDDDAALHWAGDEARGQAAPRLRGEPVADADGTDAASAAGTAAAASADRRTPRELALLVATGVFGGLYLALAVGWILSVQLLGYPGLDLAGEVMWQFGEFLAMIAAVLWFGAALTLTPPGTAHRGAKRFVALLLGVALLLPWPFLLGALG
ncbi:hypothetical protein [Protaetiibacter intestinalis]|uniref:DNA polymerase III subunit gamma/tau n=1 Tax=Protaetiibacter intestinalis TaxID=2419774 RepID=A0A387B7Q8_9MICO|nr:hypothetical protein [Protaetiibacter intestinalis]AYF97126.1 hypothetical protein D7I47_01925 [Protaetiibacter intestinalis]